MAKKEREKKNKGQKQEQKEQNMRISAVFPYLDGQALSPINLLVCTTEHGGCLALLRLIWGTPKQRPPVDSGDVRRKYGARGWHGIPMRAAHNRTSLAGGGTGFM